MRRICLTLPTNRECTAALLAVGGEAAHAAAAFGVEVHYLVLDSTPPDTFAAHAAAAARCRAPGVVVHHLGEDDQRAFLRRVVARSDAAADPDALLALMLPSALSYGACTNRAFLFAAALGCTSVHRRDSDSTYQVHGGRPVHPVHHELLTLGRTAADAAAHVTGQDLGPALAGRRVALAGASFTGAMSVDMGEVLDLDPDTYAEMVGLWAPADWPPERRRRLVAESFRGAGDAPFTGDRSLLTRVDPMRVDMCNIAFHSVHEQVPLPPATDTIGSDYFLIHLVHDAGLPGVLHNRHIVNHHTPERRTDPGFAAYQLRFTKFLLSMLYFNALYRSMAEAGDSLLDASGAVRTRAVAALARRAATLDTAENAARLDALDRCYRRLGGRYARVAESLAPRRERLLAEARRDIEDFALLTEAWPHLVRASRTVPVPGVPTAAPGVSVPSAPERAAAGSAP
ncbi:DUF6271 family protein [Streptomyces sp. NPDC090077]|uniref:DUF6271 family protein n=1 Tax=Streptomyces sp. NPDC090077 TaxID=3365938 RepID=UPI003820DC2E